MDGFLINGEREVPREGKDGQMVKKQKNEETKKQLVLEAVYFNGLKKNPARETGSRWQGLKGRAWLCFVPRFHPSGLGVYTGFFFQIASEKPACGTWRAGRQSSSETLQMPALKALKTSTCYSFKVKLLLRLMREAGQSGELQSLQADIILLLFGKQLMQRKILCDPDKGKFSSALNTKSNPPQ